MIVQKPTEGFEDRLVHTYSDEGYKIRQVETGVVYDAADDVIPCRYTYEETDEKIEAVGDEDETVEEAGEDNE